MYLYSIVDYLYMVDLPKLNIADENLFDSGH